MKAVFGSRRRTDAQTLVFFLVAWGTIMLLCGLAIDSGLLYLAKARLARAVDGAALAAVGNFNLNTDPTTNRDDVAKVVRDFAAANYTDLSSIGASGSSVPGGAASSYTQTDGSPGTSYTYNFNDGTRDANNNYRRFVQVVFNTGSGGAITSANVTARCPAQTYFIGYATYAINGKTPGKIGGYSGPSSLVDLKVSSSAVATRRPRLIMVVIDRSASMLAAGGGASGLPPAVVQFLDFFDTSSDNIGIVSFGSAARLEMPLTTNFLIAGTNNLIDAYNTNSQGVAIPGIDPEMEPTNQLYDPNYTTTGVRRLKFGGSTAADDGIRLGMEQLMANPGFTDPDVIKYMVIFTDGKWNSSRTLFAAPGYVNNVSCPSPSGSAPYVSILTNGAANGMSNGQYVKGPDGTNQGPWSTNVAADTNLIPMPSLGINGHSLPFITNAIAYTVNPTPSDFETDILPQHTNDTWQSIDSSPYEPLKNPGTTPTAGASMTVNNTTWVGVSGNGATNFYTHNVDVWLQPGSVAYLYHSGAISNNGAYVSDYTNPTKHINLYVASGDSVRLVVPGYVADGLAFDGLDLPYSPPEDQNWPRYRSDNWQQAFMWPDDNAPITVAEPTGGYVANSLQRQLMFRNYPNLLTGFYVNRPDYPLGSGYEPLITEDNPPGAPRPLDPLGPYYPGAAFYWPFDLVGADVVQNYALINPLSDPDPNGSTTAIPGGSRHLAYSENMLSTNAAPQWAGELFYDSISGGGTGVTSGTGSTSVSQVMTSASEWQAGAPAFIAPFISTSGLMTSDAVHDTNITPSPAVWRPACFNGSAFASVTSVSSVTPGGSTTGGWVSDGTGHYYPNAMAWSGRPTHYFDFSQSKWVQVSNNHVSNLQFLPLGIWKAQEYAWHARALGVTIYTVGYGTAVNAAECALLAQVANSTNVIAPNGSGGVVTNANTYNPGQPIGEQFYALTAADISNDFYSVGQAINAALTQ